MGWIFYFQNGGGITTPVGLSMYILIQKCTSDPITHPKKMQQILCHAPVCIQSQPTPHPPLGIATAKCIRAKGIEKESLL